MNKPPEYTPEQMLSEMDRFLALPLMFTSDFAPLFAALALIWQDIDIGECAACTCGTCVRMREILENFESLVP